MTTSSTSDLRPSDPSPPPGEGPRTPTRPEPTPADVPTTPGRPVAPHEGAGPKVGKYVILGDELAGGMGVVYQAHDTELDRVVALKMIKAGALATAEETARFRREARAAARLDHPHIIPVYEVGRHEGCLYFTMPFARGGNLAQQRDRFADDPRAAVALVEKVARAVHHAHRHGILHRDLKPANILLDERGEPWVSDFGLAKFLDDGPEWTQTGQLLGTPAYMAPEQAGGQTRSLAAPTDVWSLGVILYELLTGRRPFGGKGDEQLWRVRESEPPPPRSARPSIGRDLETVVLKCLEKEPAARYASAEALADDLARWLRGEPVLARPPSRAVRAWRAARRWRRPVGGLALAAVLLVLLVLAWRGLSPPPTPEPVEEGDRAALEEKQARLHNGEKVVLLGESGPPAWWRWQPRRSTGRTMLDLKQVFRVFGDRQPALVELLPEAPSRFRLRADVQYVAGAPHGEVGVYFARGRRPTQEGVTHCFFKLSFNEHFPTGDLAEAPSPDEPAGQVRLTLTVCRERKGVPFSRHLNASCALSRRFPPAGDVEPKPWRTLVAEVAPDWIRVFWEDELIRNAQADGCDPNTALDAVARLLGLPALGHPKDRSPDPVVDAELGLGGGLGLYVEQGTAAFRSVVIEPLPPR